MPNKSWFCVNSAATDAIEVYIYDVIGRFGVSDRDFISALNDATAERPGAPVHIRINSPGGDVQMGVGIYTALERIKPRVTTFIDGWAASMASIIALAGSKTYMSKSGMFMLHNPHTLVIGDEAEMLQAATFLREVRASLIGVYMEKTGKTEAEISDLMNAETWLRADPAKEAGFIDEIGIEAKASAHFNPSEAGAHFKAFKDEYAVAAGPIATPPNWFEKVTSRFRADNRNIQEITEMEWKDITVKGLQDNRPELVAEFDSAAAVQRAEAEKAAKDSAVKLERERVSKITAQLRDHHWEAADGEQSLGQKLLSGDVSAEDAFVQIIAANEAHAKVKVASATMAVLEAETAATNVGAGGAGDHDTPSAKNLAGLLASQERLGLNK